MSPNGAYIAGAITNNAGSGQRTSGEGSGTKLPPRALPPVAALMHRSQHAIAVWDGETGEEIGELLGHDGAITTV
eukprot:scaffold650780_cov45-Prasinocladus_malaysianus.AAC.1